MNLSSAAADVSNSTSCDTFKRFQQSDAAYALARSHPDWTVNHVTTYGHKLIDKVRSAQDKIQDKVKCQHVLLWSLSALDDYRTIALAPKSMSNAAITSHVRKGSVGQCFHTGKQVLDDTERCSSATYYGKVEQLLNIERKNGIALPLPDKDGLTIGVLQLLNKEGAGDFDEEDVKKLKGFFKDATNIAKEIRATNCPFETLGMYAHDMTSLTGLQAFLESRETMIEYGDEISFKADDVDGAGDISARMLNLDSNSA